MSQPLQGRLALVTGASRGIGRASALALARAGAHVIATATNQGALEELDDEIAAATGAAATLVPLDLKDGNGIDMPDRDRLLAATKSHEEMREMLEVDTLGFLSLDGLYEAMGAGRRDPADPQFTDHYFTGDYPTRLTDREIAEGRNDAVERQLSLLVEA